MFNTIFKKLGEAEQELNKVMSTTQKPMSETLEPIPDESSLKQDNDRLRLKLQNGAIEYNKLFAEKEALKQQLTTFASNKQEKDRLEKELNQLRLSNKLKVAQLQKEIESLKVSKPDDDSTQEILLLKSRIQELQTTIEKNEQGLEKYQEQIISLQEMNENKDEPLLLEAVRNELLKVATFQNQDNSKIDRFILESVKVLVQQHLSNNSDTLNNLSLEEQASIPNSDQQTENNASPEEQSKITNKNDEQLENGIKSLKNKISELELINKNLAQDHQDYIKSIQTKFLDQQKLLQTEFQAQLDKKEREMNAMDETLKSLEIQVDMLRMNQQVEGASSSSGDAELKAQLEKEVARSKELSIALEEVQEKLTKHEEMDMGSFSFQEQINDYKIQLAQKQQEIQNLKAADTTKTDEMQRLLNEKDEKLKKFKSLLMSANKGMSDVKKILGEKEALIDKLQSTGSQYSEKEASLNAKIDELTASLNKKNEELEAIVQGENSKVEELELQLSTISKQLENQKTEFQEYRARAHAILQQNGSVKLEQKIETLEQQLNERDREILALERKLSATQNESNVQRKELGIAISRVDQLERELEILRTTGEESKRLSEQLQQIQLQIAEKEQNYQQAIEQMKASREEALALKSAQYSESIKEFEKSLSEKQAEKSLIEEKYQNLQVDLEALREQNAKLKLDYDRLKQMTRKSSMVEITTPTQPKAELDSFKEKEYQLKIDQLSNILSENQKEIQLYHDQVQHLKNQIQKLDREEGRSNNVNLEYLKNIVVSFLESKQTSRQPLIPIISRMLLLTPEEEQRLKNAIEVDGVKTNSIGFGFF